MPLFQVSVLKNYLKQQDPQVVSKAYKKYSKYFLNPVTQENIRNSKEEEFQALFLNELFVKILGYTIKPSPNYNLTTEFKNETNNRKADGAIISEGKAIGVVELKGTKTKDLESIRKQAFDYKVNNSECVYVITSNFEKLRFYINDSSNEEEFNLFTLSEEEFSLLYLCLQKDNISNNIPLSIKKTSVVEEEKITKGFYKDYSLFKRELYRDLVKQNGTRLKNEARETLKDFATDEALREESERIEKNVKLSLFKKSQKLIDRFLFIFFAEDRGLLPPNFAIKIINDWKGLREQYVEISLYERFKLYFNFLDKGRKGENGKAEVYAYNGGLFKPDVILDSLLIDDDMLSKHSAKLAKYDFESQVDVNILGHIFENSLNEIESVNAEIEGSEFDKQKSKRKKDGVFYTPSYITKYIVENTLGKLCEGKKRELSITYDNYKPAKQRSRQRLENLEQYREWLLQLTICDPACGSGAFLNQALDFLISEHNYIDELSARYNRDNITLSNIEHVILENNIYGVDLNEESVEIAKLSLWLRTAQPRRKLSNLSDNIKCGNSLIDNTSIGGHKAFNWEEQFPKIFIKGGFDVVIGNPPYVRPRSLSIKQKDWLVENYICAENQFDLYHLFIEKAENIKHREGIVSFILPNAFLANQNSIKLRKYILDFCTIDKIIECGSKVFADASVEVLIYIFFSKTKKSEFGVLDNSQFVRLNYFNSKLFYKNKNLNFTVTLSESGMKLHQEIQKNSHRLGDLTKVMGGIKEYQVGKGQPPQTKEDREFLRFNSTEKLNNTFVKEVRGRHINPFYLNWNDEYISYGPWIAEPRKPEFFKGQRIFMRQIPGKQRLYACFTDEDFIVDQSAYVIKPKQESEFKINAVLPLLNSKLLFWYYRNENNEFDNLFPKIKSKEIQNLPIHKNFKSQESKFLNCSNRMSTLNSSLFKIVRNFSKFLNQSYSIEKPSNKIQNWHQLDFGHFIKELLKEIKKENKKRNSKETAQITKLSKNEEFEWMAVFEENKKKTIEIQLQIDQTENEINQMVYELYELTDKEIRIVEQK